MEQIVRSHTAIKQLLKIITETLSEDSDYLNPAAINKLVENMSYHRELYVENARKVACTLKNELGEC